MAIFSKHILRSIKGFFLIGLLLAGVEVVAQNKEEKLPEIILGSVGAPITVIEYSCFRCGHCAEFQQNIFPRIKNYIEQGKIRYIQRQFPLDEMSLKAAQIVYCPSVPQSQRERLAVALYTHQEKLVSEEKLLQLFAQQGISKKVTKNCLQNERIQRGILSVRLNAQQQFNVRGTPTFFINGKKIVGCPTYEEFEKHIKEAQHRSEKKISTV